MAIDVETLVDEKIAKLPKWVLELIDESDRDYYRRRLKPREEDSD